MGHTLQQELWCISSDYREWWHDQHNDATVQWLFGCKKSAVSRHRDTRQAAVNGTNWSLRCDERNFLYMNLVGSCYKKVNFQQ